MRIDIITAVPDLLTSPFAYSIMQRAQNKNIVEICIHNLREYGLANHYKTIDDAPYGGGAGMVLMIEPIDKCISMLKQKRTYDEIIYMSPDGELFSQQQANYLSTLKNIILLCGHYKGIDQRVRDYLVTKEISIGDYVLSGGELAAAVITDAVVRLIPGVLNDETSALTDSFQDGLLAPPVYTRPANYNGHTVPSVLLSGNFKEIEKWRNEKAMENTIKKRPDLLS